MYCFQCDQCPCDKDLHKNNRVRAFNHTAKNESLLKLAEYLYLNSKKGITYHRPDGLAGDYDKCKTEEEVIDLLRNGKPNPYEVRPSYESTSFLLHLVSRDDAVDLLNCYSNPESQKYFNTDNCTSDFLYSTLEEMQECIETWLSAYQNEWYVRFSIVDKRTEKAVGTAEIFGGKHGVLRIDLLPQYENKSQLSELLSIADAFFFDFNCGIIVTKVFSDSEQRIEALHQNNYLPYPQNEDWNRENYYMKKLY